MSGTSTGLFYAVAKNIHDDVTYRYLIVFATRHVANSWYRAVTDSVAAGNPKYAGVKRVSPQFYTHDPYVGLIPLTITEDKVALSLRGKIFFTLLNDRDGRIIDLPQVLNYTDHVNGASFYIRSAAKPDTFWFFDPQKNTVIASHQARTRFIVTIADKAKGPGTAIVGDDEIFVATTSGTNIGVTGKQDNVTSSNNPFPLRFSSFFNGNFEIDFEINGDHQITNAVVQNPGKGEEWELV